jgi:hypothetical protein
MWIKWDKASLYTPVNPWIFEGFIVELLKKTRKIRLMKSLLRLETPPFELPF